MTEPTLPPEWAIERAQKALGFETPNDELAPWLASKFRELRNDVAAALVAVRREALLEAVFAAKTAQLPSHYQWGHDAMEQFNFGKERSALAIAALADKEPI